MRKAIIIMAKVPRPGSVKTRLRPFLNDGQCAELATAFLRDAETRAKCETDNTIVAFDPPSRKKELEALLYRKHVLIEQAGKGLGERMSNAFESAFESGFAQVVMIGTDSPGMPQDSISMAFRLLKNGSDAVLGKTMDGGFYLVGLTGSNRRIFENVDWGTERTAVQTVRNMDVLGLKISYVNDWKDVDRPTDLEELNRELTADSGPAPETYKWLSNNRSMFS
jgi:rSAM/selenodomain-associated transferase 1